MNNYYIKDTGYGWGVFSWGEMVAEFVTYEEAEGYINEHTY